MRRCSACDRPAFTVLVFEGAPLSGPVCIDHADVVMEWLSTLVPEDEGKAGFAKWKADTEHLERAS